MKANKDHSKSLYETLGLTFGAQIERDPSEIGDGKEDIDSETLEEQVTLKKAQRERYQSDTKDRKWLTEWSTAIVSIWLFLVFIILISNSGSLHLSDSVLNMLLGTTTLNVLGLMYIVLRGHFNNKE